MFLTFKTEAKHLLLKNYFRRRRDFLTSVFVFVPDVAEALFTDVLAPDLTLLVLEGGVTLTVFIVALVSVKSIVMLDFGAVEVF